jgi:hypothetical protein
VFGAAEVLQALAPHREFFAQCVLWDKTKGEELGEMVV